MNRLTRILALVLAFVMCLAMFVACKPADDQNDGNNDDENNENKDNENENTKPLVVGYAPFNSKFSPFFAETAYDQDVAAMTGLGLLTSDRTGAIIYKGIDGETIKYNGTDYTYYGPANLVITEEGDKIHYDFTLREDIKFSDGEAVTVDDVIFSMYVLSDPAYDGSSTFFALPIEGMKEYRAGMSTKYELILKDGPEASAAGTEFYTADEAAAFWAAFEKAGINFVSEIRDVLINTYAANTEEDSIKAVAANWGYELEDDAELVDFWNAIVAAKGYDLSDEGINFETAGTSITSFLTAELDSSMIVAVKTGESAANIAGIKKTGANTLRVTLTELDAVAIYQLGITIAPLHYYGSDAEFDYDNNKFGFTKGDLSSVRAKTTQPLGAGPYKFIKFENGVVSFEANANYFLGAPKTKYINFLETNEEDKLNGVSQGTIDITDPSLNEDIVEQITEKNNGVFSGDVIAVSTVDNLGYGYIGISANRVNVAGDIDSDASKNLRKALATVLAVYRDISVDSYYGERASVINYPISNTSWAAPQMTDDGYKVAFSEDVDGNPIYTSEMTAEEKYTAALNAAIGYFKAAGYTFDDATGKFTAAPEGAKLEYELWIPAEGKGDHPSFMVCSLARDAFATIGITVVVKDLANSSDLWTSLEAEGVDMWCAAWGATVDPDMYQIYFAGDETNAAGGSNYMYDINDAELNKLILDARKSMDQAYRKTMYKACLDIIVDWAVEIPVYQRQNAIIFAAERIKMETVTPDITTFYGWMAEIQNLELK